MAQTAEGALQESTNILQRMRELAVQSANDTNSASDRTSLQAEVNQLKQEMTRIADTTEFNGKKLLDGTLTNANFQIGANSGETISISIGDARAASLGITSIASAPAVNGTATITGGGFDWLPQNGFWHDASGVLSVNGTPITFAGGGTSQMNSAKNIVAGLTGAGITATVIAPWLNPGPVVALSGPLSAGDLIINGVDAVGQQWATTADFTTWVEANVPGANIFFGTALGMTDGSNLVIQSDGVNATSDRVFTNYDFNSGTSQVHSSIGGVNITGNGALTIDTALTTIPYGIRVDAGTTGSDAIFGPPATVTMDKVDISTNVDANTAISSIDIAISQVDTMRGDLGAVQNRFESTIANLSNVSENLSAARSRIMDADIAQETSAMTKNNILQQAGVSILSQANQAPQLVLSLLK